MTNGGHDEDRDGQILPVELGHARLRNRPGRKRRGVYAGPFFAGGIGNGRKVRSCAPRRLEARGRGAERPSGASLLAPKSSVWPRGERSPTPDDPAAAPPPTRRARRSCCRAAGTRAWPRSGCCGRCSSAGIVPDVVIGTSAGALNGAAVGVLAEPHRRRAARERLDLAHRRRRVPGRAGSAGPGTSCAAGTHLFEATGLDALIDRATPARSVRRPRGSAARDRHRPRHRRRGRVRARAAQARAARERRAPGRVPDRRARRPAARRRRRRQHRAAVARDRRARSTACSCSTCRPARPTATSARRSTS